MEPDFAVFSPDGNWLAVEYGEAGVQLFDARTGKASASTWLFNEEGEEDAVKTLVFSPDSRGLFVNTANHGLYIFELVKDKTPKEVKKIDVSPDQLVWPLRNSVPLLISHSDGQVQINEDPVEHPPSFINYVGAGHTFIEDTGSVEELSALAHLTLVGSKDGLRLYSLAGKEAVVLLDLPNEEEMISKISPNERWLAVKMSDGELGLWDLSRIFYLTLPAKNPIASPKSIKNSPTLSRVGPWSDDLILALSGLRFTATYDLENVSLSQRFEACDRLRKLKFEGPGADVEDSEWARLLRWWLTPVSQRLDGRVWSVSPTSSFQGDADFLFARAEELRQRSGKFTQESFELYQRAAQLGYAPAQHRVGVAYALGQIVSKRARW